MSEEAKRVLAKDVMMGNFEIVDGMMPVTKAIELFREKKAQALIVDKRHDHDEYGFLLLSDIAKKVIARDRSPERVNVYEIMAKPVLSVRPDMDIKYCARMFENFGLSRAPVIENGKVVGLIGYTNMVMNSLL